MSHKAETDVLKAKLSKKIAELTMVVQMLFTRNHEKELELSATKKACEEEIRRVTEEGKGKLNWLEKQLDDLERFRTLLEMKTDECERTKATVETLHEKQLQAEQRVIERGAMLSEALAEIENLKKEIASRSPEEVEALRRQKSVLSNELSSERENLAQQKDLVGDLHNKVELIQANLNNMLNENQTLKLECTKLKDDLSFAHDEVRTLTQSLHEARKHGERALQRTRKLEEKNKQIAAEKLALERNHEQLNEQMNKLLLGKQYSDKPIERTRPSSPKKVDINALALAKLKPKPTQKDDEVQFLKREIEKYRLELKNREVNFNRVFAEKTPLVIKKPAEITAEEMRLRNLTGLTSYRKAYATLPAVVRSEAKQLNDIHSTTKKMKHL
ncbi:spindle pole body component 110-like [Dendronephthya gigantea]|uniref:spindle pole body component 110-like n=1 Tax=Dendronephthya gigantea TaxID=151771 RepID=UPI00106BAE18|nr:spindle pole body component 110-like [Dendronephthya gigantea]